MAVTIKVEGAKELIAKLTTLEQLKKVQQTIYDEAKFLKEELASYPKNAHGPNPLLRGKGEKANAMRRGFFWHLKNGDISVPYSRTSNLGDRWSVTSQNSGWTAVVGNDISYNSWVQGPEQTIGHANSGWLTVDKAKEDNEAGIIERITAALEEEVADVG
jgi:hypothetical protein